jgi:formate-dependent nitrite reductase membrane component NrfD
VNTALVSTRTAFHGTEKKAVAQVQKLIVQIDLLLVQFFLSDTVLNGDRFLITVSMVLLNITWILLPYGKL